ncbi:MAG TPA: NAD(P)-dependent oxidoreductase [candidate division Zixibacteria bacterium]|jgi:3-hydroxyisobutyrate dehydrogenase|nr:NAD(P)-dependent oxidoreductase [candidate division Zixibacteria bacterium]
MAIGFIGLGNLGRAIAERLISQGEELIVWNRSKQKTEGLKATIAESPADLISIVQTCFLCLSDSKAVKAMLESEHGILKGNCDGKLIIDITTNHFDSVLSFYRELGEHGASYLESPVSGSVIPASQGNLIVMVSGDNKSFERAKPLLQKIGKQIFYLEKPALATKMKLVTNFVLGSFMVAISEALVLGEEAGIDKKTIIDILLAGAGNSMILNAKKEKLLSEDFSPHFSMAMIAKDLGYIEALARSQKRPLYSAVVAKELYDKAISDRMETLDFSAIYKVIKDLK